MSFVTGRTYYIYSFISGDVMGLLINVEAQETIQDLIDRSLQSAEIRHGINGQHVLLYKNRVLENHARIQDTEIKNLERVDIRKRQDLNA